jgi:hypothetical protein
MTMQTMGWALGWAVIGGLAGLMAGAGARLVLHPEPDRSMGRCVGLSVLVAMAMAWAVGKGSPAAALAASAAGGLLPPVLAALYARFVPARPELPNGLRQTTALRRGLRAWRAQDVPAERARGSVFGRAGRRPRPATARPAARSAARDEEEACETAVPAGAIDARGLRVGEEPGVGPWIHEEQDCEQIVLPTRPAPPIAPTATRPTR